MKKLCLLATLILSSSGLANSEEEKSVNFLEIGITSMNYVQPVAPEEVGGTMVFTEATMSRADLTFNLTNKNNQFDSAMLYRKDFIGFKASTMNIDFKLGEGSTFNGIKKLDVLESLAVINPSFFTFGGDEFFVFQDTTKIGLKNYFAFCTANDDEVDMATADGIVHGCLAESYVSAQDEEKPLELSFENLYEDGDTMKFKAELNSLNISESQFIKVDASKSTMKVSNYDIKTSTLDFSCQKDSGQHEMDTDKLKIDCENTLDLKANKIVMENSEEQTKFFINLDELKIANEEVKFSSPAIQFVDRTSSTTTFDLSLNCKKDYKAPVYDLHETIAQCIDRGEISIGRVATNDDEKSLYWNYNDIFEKNYDPISTVDRKEKSVKNVSIKLNGKTFVLEANAYKKIVFGKYIKLKIFVKGEVFHYPKKDQIVLKVNDMRVPVGWFELKWKSFFLGIAKKALVGEMISFDDDIITIQL